jgi:glycosyltransferase involved in cell wall biosynthesis
MTSPLLQVLQVSSWYPPFQIGGTEVYLEGLVAALRHYGVDSSVLVPRLSPMPERFDYAGTSVETYYVNEIAELGEFKRGLPHRDFDSFQQQLMRKRDAIYHQHSWTRGCGPHHLRAARNLGMRTVVTVHIPSNICLRGTMMRFGEAACDGHVIDKLCGACWAQSKGMPRAIAQTVSKLPLPAAKLLRQHAGTLATALSARSLGAEKVDRLREMFANSDRIIAVCGWLRDALLANGAPSNKLVLSRQGVSDDLAAVAHFAHDAPVDPRSPLRLLYLGRLHPVKGVDVVVQAIRSLPVSLNVSLTVRSPSGGPEEQAYEARVRALAGSDSRFSFEGAVARNELASVLSGFDGLVVPSVWLETGPLVVLEAKAAGLFVLGSRLGGIAELIDGPDEGELVTAGDLVAWADAIRRLSGRRASGGLPRLVSQVRTMEAAAADMAEIYRSL